MTASALSIVFCFFGAVVTGEFERLVSDEAALDDRDTAGGIVGLGWPLLFLRFSAVAREGGIHTVFNASFMGIVMSA